MTETLTQRAVLIKALAVCLLLPGAISVGAAQDAYIPTMKFAAEMAKQGNWREAKYRWELVAKKEPDNPKILNNLAVAHEALGDPEAARATYEKALSIAKGHTIIEANLSRAAQFWSKVEQTGDGDAPTYDSRGYVPGDPEQIANKKKGKSFKVTVKLPVPPRLDLGDRDSLLVASFLTQESDLLDINRELVRFVRSEFRKHTELEILPVVPPPAVPEQTIEDLVANSEFWKHLGREYGADVLVSGVMLYDRRDASGFRDVDIVSPTTGQKIRQSRFVEQERFNYELDIIFMDGTTGELLFRDRLQRSVLFRGSQNDPITAFFELSDTIAPDVLAIVRPRTREDIRFVYKK